MIYKKRKTYANRFFFFYFLYNKEKSFLLYKFLHFYPKFYVDLIPKINFTNPLKNLGTFFTTIVIGPPPIYLVKILCLR